MKSNKILGTVLLSGLVLSLATPAFAATAEEIQKDLNKSNDMQVKISPAENIDPEVDPTKPIIDPPEVINGSIGISQVSPLFFKEIKLSGKQQLTSAQFYTREIMGDLTSKATEYTGKIESEYADEASFPDKAITPSMQVVDARGTREGWTVTAKLSELKANDEVMKGASLIYSNPIVTSTADNADVSSYPTSPLGESVEISADGTSSDVVLSAGNGQGAGTFYARYNPKAFKIADKDFAATPIQLKVPSSAKKGDYKGTVTYTLTPIGTQPEAK